MTFGDLTYEKVDEDGDGTYDYIIITDCDESVTEVEIPNEINGLSVTKIGEFAFSSCETLTSMTIPNSVTSINSYAFNDIPLLENQTGVKYVDKWAVDCDKDVTTAKIKKGTKGIADETFFHCKSLESITIPDSITEIGDGVFRYCSSLEYINVSENNKNYSNIDGVLFNKDKTEILAFPLNKKDTQYSIPSSVKSIKNYVFEGNRNLIDIIIPNNVIYIGSHAFNGSVLENVEIPKNVELIAAFAFDDCKNLKNIKILNPKCEIEEPAISNVPIKLEYPTFNGIIYGYKDSTAQAYAEKYDYTFESLGEPPAKPEPGDLSGDGTIDFLDLVHLSKLLLPGAKISDEQLSIADLNGNGKLDFLDLVLLSQELLKNANK